MGGPEVVLLSEGLWRQSFQADPGIVGKAVKISGKPHTVVGVMPSRFISLKAWGRSCIHGVWLPMQPTGEMLKDRGYHFTNVVARCSRESPWRRHSGSWMRSRRIFPRRRTTRAITFRATPYQETLTGPVRPVLYGALGALALVLVDRLRECFESPDCPLPGAAAGVCSARGAGRRAGCVWSGKCSRKE